MGGGQGGCDRRSEVFLNFKKKSGGGVGRIRFGRVGGVVTVDLNKELKFWCKLKKKWGGGGGRVGGGGQGGCERRSEVFLKIQKKFRGGVGSGQGGRVRGGGGQGGSEQRIEVFV